MHKKYDAYIIMSIQKMIFQIVISRSYFKTIVSVLRSCVLKKLKKPNLHQSDLICLNFDLFSSLAVVPADFAQWHTDTVQLGLVNFSPSPKFICKSCTIWGNQLEGIVQCYDMSSASAVDISMG